MTIIICLSTDVCPCVPVCVRACMCVCVVMQKIEARVAADEDLKLADLLKYYLRESQAAKVLCSRCCSSFGVSGKLTAFPGHVTAAGPSVPQGPGSGGLRERQQGSGQSSGQEQGRPAGRDQPAALLPQV